MKKRKSAMLFLFAAMTVVSFVRCSDAYAPIRNDCFWQTVDGDPLYSQGGGIFRFADPCTGAMRYFWYGVRYAEADAYRRDPSVTLEMNHFEGVACYSSDDLSHWKYEADVLTRFHSVSAWSLDVRTGRWRVDAENNYVLNGSFEADRRPVPNPVKPVQDYLTGWRTEVERGCCIAVGDSLSPQLNYLNTREDRRFVIGEKSLRMQDAVSFRRRVSQQIGSSNSVALPDGRYTLQAMVRVNGRFDALEMYAASGSHRRVSDLTAMPDAWTKVVMDDIAVSGGTAEIGFLADGDGGACCLVDDVRFVRE